MDYEKEYKDAMERAKKWGLTHKLCIEDIFPELAESDDERIRRGMIDEIKAILRGEDLEFPPQDVLESRLAYLEKQKESLHISETCKEKPNSFTNEDERIRKEIYNFLIDMECKKEWIAYLERQKEYELTEEDKKIIPEALVMLCDDIINHRVHTPIKTDEEGARKIKAFLKTFNRQPHKTMKEWEKQKEQKLIRTAKEMWEEMRLEVYAQASGNRHEPNYSDDSTKMFSLCDIDEIFEKIGDSTIGSQPAEWSEEDEKQIRQIERIVKDAGGSVKLQEQIHNWFESLRPQPHSEWRHYMVILLPPMARSITHHLLIKTKE